MIKTLISSLISLLIIISSQGANYSSSSLHDYSISKISVGEELSQSTVYSILEDSEGFIWIGTRGDGTKIVFHKFPTD